MKKESVNLKHKLQQINQHWSPDIVSKLNDHQIKLAKIKGEYVWHSHEETDELFVILFGSMRIDFRDDYVNLNEGEIYVVPKGVEHKPIAEQECHIMLIEL